MLSRYNLRKLSHMCFLYCRVPKSITESRWLDSPTGGGVAQFEDVLSKILKSGMTQVVKVSLEAIRERSQSSPQETMDTVHSITILAFSEVTTKKIYIFHRNQWTSVLSTRLKRVF